MESSYLGQQMKNCVVLDIRLQGQLDQTLTKNYWGFSESGKRLSIRPIRLLNTYASYLNILKLEIFHLAEMQKYVLRKVTWNKALANSLKPLYINDSFYDCDLKKSMKRCTSTRALGENLRWTTFPMTEKMEFQRDSWFTRYSRFCQEWQLSIVIAAIWLIRSWNSLLTEGISRRL